MQEAKQNIHQRLLGMQQYGSIPYHVLSCDIILQYIAILCNVCLGVILPPFYSNFYFYMHYQ